MLGLRKIDSNFRPAFCMEIAARSLIDLLYLDTTLLVQRALLPSSCKIILTWPPICGDLASRPCSILTERNAVNRGSLPRSEVPYVV